MRKKLLLFFLALLSSAMTLTAAGLPRLSSGSNVTWYFIKFVDGGNVLEARADAQNTVQSGMIGREAQLWKFEGNLSTGCTVTNKLGQRLYLTSVNSSAMAVAAKTTYGYDRFTVTASRVDGRAAFFEIHPVAAPAISLSQRGGSGVGKEVGVRASGGHPDNVVTFEEESTVAAYRALPALIPYPRTLTLRAGTALNARTLRSVTFPADSLRDLATDFAARLGRSAGTTVGTKTSGTAAEAGAVSLLMDRSLAREAYRLSVTASGVEIRASSRPGFAFALQTLSQLLPPAFRAGTPAAAGAWNVPGMDVSDQPAYGYRGVMIDVARHFYDKAEMKRIIDLLAFYKINRLQWHLTDDQGWRIAIPEYPRLTAVGSRRDGSLVNAVRQPWIYDDTEYGRGLFYTLADLKEIGAYAAARGVEIVPEIDVPGHADAVLAAYPEFSCRPFMSYKVRVAPGTSREVLNVGDDRVIEFLQTVLGHVAEAFPGSYIHLGGSRVATERWRDNALCRQRVADERLDNFDQLQPWLIARLARRLAAQYKKTVIVRDEQLTESNLPFWRRNAAVRPLVMIENDYDGARRDKRPAVLAAELGWKSIAAPAASLGLDRAQAGTDESETDADNPGSIEAGAVTLPQVYDYNAATDLAAPAAQIAGLQGNLATFVAATPAQLEYLLLPRLQALAENAWTPAAQKNRDAFLVRLQAHAAALDAMGYAYARHYFFGTRPTPFAELLAKADTYLRAIRPGQPGHVSQAALDRFRTAVNAARTAGASSAGALNTLTNAIYDLRNAPVTPPAAGQTYTLVSAASDPRRPYAGVLLAENGGELRAHGASAYEPGAFFTFTAADGGLVMRALRSGRRVHLPDYDADARMTDADSTLLRIDGASVADAAGDFAPGAVVISAADDYSAERTGGTKRLCLRTVGDDRTDADRPNVSRVAAYDEPSVGGPATWYLVPADFRAMLQNLAARCADQAADAEPDKPGQISRTAVAYLDALRSRIAAALARPGQIDRAAFENFAEQYDYFLRYPRVTPTESLNQNYLYVLRNAAEPDYVARLDANGTLFPSRLADATRLPSNALWSVVRADEGIYLVSKAGNRSVTVFPQTDGATVSTVRAGAPGGEYVWKTRLYTTSDGITGVNILTADGRFAWYARPEAYKTIVLKPGEWPGALWVFEKTDFTVGIDAVRAEKSKVSGPERDLSGRPADGATRGVVIRADGTKTMRR